MKQYEAVIQVMEENGGFATLGYLNQNVLSFSGCEWKTKTPFASIRRIVQDKRFFFRIRPGLWALKKHKKEILKKFDVSENSGTPSGHSLQLTGRGRQYNDFRWQQPSQATRGALNTGQVFVLSE